MRDGEVIERKPKPTWPKSCLPQNTMYFNRKSLRKTTYWGSVPISKFHVRHIGINFYLWNYAPSWIADGISAAHGRSLHLISVCYVRVYRVDIWIEIPRINAHNIVSSWFTVNINIHWMQFRFWLQTGEQNTECTNCHKRRISARYIVMVPCYLTAHVRMVSSSWHGDLCSQASKLSHTIVDLTWKTRFMSTHALFPSVCLETKVHRCIVKRKPNLFACLTFAIYQHKGNLWIRCEQRVFNSLWPKKGLANSRE